MAASSVPMVSQALLRPMPDWSRRVEDRRVALESAKNTLGDLSIGAIVGAPDEDYDPPPSDRCRLDLLITLCPGLVGGRCTYIFFSQQIGLTFLLCTRIPTARIALLANWYGESSSVSSSNERMDPCVGGINPRPFFCALTRSPLAKALAMGLPAAEGTRRRNRIPGLIASNESELSIPLSAR